MGLKSSILANAAGIDIARCTSQHRLQVRPGSTLRELREALLLGSNVSRQHRLNWLNILLQLGCILLLQPGLCNVVEALARWCNLALDETGDLRDERGRLKHALLKSRLRSRKRSLWWWRYNERALDWRRDRRRQRPLSS